MFNVIKRLIDNWKSRQSSSTAYSLHCRVRYFTNGAVLGGKGFVEEFFENNRHRFGAKRKTGAHPKRFGEWDDLRTHSS